MRRSLSVPALALVFWLPATAGSAAERRGGIEIGGKGVKATIVELGDAPGAAARTVYTEAANTTVIAGVAESGAYAAEAIADTAAEVGKFAEKMRRDFGLKPDQIRVIGSSGLPGASNRGDLAKAVDAASGAGPMEFITPAREVELTIAGLVPESDRGASLLVDVGSGNTKGGYLKPGGGPAFFSLPYGSVTYAGEVKKQAGDASFADAAGRLRPEALEAPLARAVAADPGLARKPTIYLSGGAAYALATLMHPEAARQSKVTLAPADIAEYARRLKAGPGVPEPDFAAIADPEVRAQAEKDYRNVADTFTPENLIAGAEILAALSKTVPFEGKTLVFDRTGVTAWIRASLTATTPAPTPSPTPAAAKPAEAPRQSLRPAVYPSPQSPQQP